jgi:CheY-like chemotaxis protein
MSLSSVHLRPPVLIVEDETLIRMGTALEFEMAGVSVMDVASADEALALLNAGKQVSAVITDLRMPGKIDGLGLARWLCQHQPHVPVIVASGYTVDLDLQDTRVSAVISKPYDVAKMIGLLNDLYSQNPGSRC